jgi:hypothetical protein
MKKYFGVVLFLVVTVICFSGCFYDLVIPESDLNSEDTEDGVVPGKGTLKIYLTDTSGNYKENDSGTYSAVYITISKIEAHIAGDNDGDKGSWKPLKQWDEGLLVNLKEYEDRSMLLALLELETNKYTQLRLFLMDEEEDDLIAWIVLKGSEESEPKIPLEIPSVYQTGIKLNRPFEIVEGMITKLTIDFDAEKSVIKTGNGKYKMKPVIHMTSETPSEEDIDTSSVSGTVSYYSGGSGFIGVGGASVSLSGGEYIFVYNTTTSGDGSFNFAENVPLGNCVLNVYADGFDDYFESIVVEEGANIVDVVLSFKETGGISGSVVDSENEAIGEATVSVSLSGGVYIFDSSTETDDDGYFSIEQLPVGTYTLNVFKEGYVENNDAIPGGIAVTEGAINNIEGKIELTLSTL